MTVFIPEGRTQYYVFFRIRDPNKEVSRQVNRSCGTSIYAEAVAKAAGIFAEEVGRSRGLVRPMAPAAPGTASSVVQKSDPSIDEILRLYDEWLRSARPGEHRPLMASAQTSKNRLRQLCRLLEVCTVGELSAAMVGLTPEKIGVTPGNFIPLLRNAAGPFRLAVMRFYAERGLSFATPFPVLPAVQRRARFAPPTAEFINKLKLEAEEELLGDPRVYLLYLLAFGAGLRVQEATHVWWEDVVADGIWVRNDIIHRTKSNRDRFIPVGSGLIAKLNRHRRTPNDWVIADGAGGGRNPDKIAKKRGERAAYHLAQWLQKKLGPCAGRNPVHYLRKVFGSVVARDHGIYTASRFLGHSSIKVTEEVYVGLISGAVANVV